MPCREARTYGNRPAGVTPASNVTDWAKVKANTGTSAAAGVVTGAWLGQPVFELGWTWKDSPCSYEENPISFAIFKMP